MATGGGDRGYQTRREEASAASFHNRTFSDANAEADWSANLLYVSFRNFICKRCANDKRALGSSVRGGRRGVPEELTVQRVHTD